VHTHSAATELLNDAVVGNGLAGEELQVKFSADFS
jgi:hypothetical protein